MAKIDFDNIVKCCVIHTCLLINLSICASSTVPVLTRCKRAVVSANRIGGLLQLILAQVLRNQLQ